jgi:hypothetical protein
VTQFVDRPAAAGRSSGRRMEATKIGMIIIASRADGI